MDFILVQTQLMLGCPRWLSGKDSACLCRRHRSDPWVRKIPWRRKRQPTSVFLPGKAHGQGSLVGYIQFMGLESGLVTYDLVTEHRHTYNLVD